MDAAKTPNPFIIIASIAVILLSAAGVSAIMGWIPKSGAEPAVPAAEVQKKAVTEARPAQKSHAVHVAAATAPSAICATCGVVDSIHEVQKEAPASGVGAVAGGVLGGVVGHQMGNGRGRDVMTVVGAVGGAVAGNAVEKNMKRTTSFQIRVRLEDGSDRVVNQATAPSWRVGDHVRVVEGRLEPLS